MKTIKYMLLVCATMFVSSINAQELRKAVLGVENFTHSSSAFFQEDADIIRNKIVEVIQRTGRVIVTDHHSSIDNALYNESERRKRESAMDANTVHDMTSLNANSLMTVNLDELTITREYYEKAESKKVGDEYKTVITERIPYYKAVLRYTVKITDCATGAVQGQRTFDVTDGCYLYLNRRAQYDSEYDAHKGIINNAIVEKDIAVFILNTFKAQGKILQMEEGNGKKAKTVYVSLGSADGIGTKQVLEVYKEMDIAGETSRRFIGEVEVVELLGSSRCLAKVKSGGDIILQVLEAGGNLPVQTRDAKAKLWGGVKY